MSRSDKGSSTGRDVGGIEAVARRDPALIRRIADRIRPALRWYFRPVVRGLERIPGGAGLYVGNHSGGTLMPDTFLFHEALLERWGIADFPYVLVHDAAIENRTLGPWLQRIGGVRATHANALAVLGGGQKLLVYPGGELDAMRPWSHRDRIVFGRRRGFVRLALEADVPLIPVVCAGGHETFMVLSDGRRLARWLGLPERLRVEVLPLTLSLPWGLAPGPLIYWPLPTSIHIEVLDPIHFERGGEEAAADDAYVEACRRQVREVMQRALTRLAAERARQRPRRGLLGRLFG